MHKICRLFGILLAVALLALVTGCGGGSGSTGGASSAEGGKSAGQTAGGAGGGGSEETAADSPGSKGSEAPAEGKTRRYVQKIVDAKLPELGLSSDEIACVDENIATMTSQEMTAGVTRPSGAETAEREEETAANFLGPLAKGCL